MKWGGSSVLDFWPELFVKGLDEVVEAFPRGSPVSPRATAIGTRRTEASSQDIEGYNFFHD